MTHSKIEISCDGCGEAFRHANFNSVDEAKTEIWAAGWQTAKMFNIVLDVCPDCQKPDSVPTNRMAE